MPIRILEPAVAAKIAAGEVVERPASIVKELVENAIDAKATSVTVDLIEGGLRQIRVTDNGEGMGFEDAALAFLRHATSKIATARDIENIGSLGFRGEALYSVAAVSMVELTTRETDAEAGTRVRMEATEMKEHSVAGSPQGTTVVVKNLFYNTPARLKFMKKPGLEAAYAADIVIRLMLAHPEVAFRFVSNGRTLYQTVGDGSLKNAMLAIYGKDLLGELLPVMGERDGMMVSGLVGTPRAARSNRTWQSFFVNGRYIRSNRLSQALEQTYGIRLMQHRHPVCALHIALPPGRVDVNISPNKMEVRFKDEPELLNLLTSAVQRGLQEGATAHTLTPGPLPGAFKKPEEAPPETGMLRFGFEGRAPRILEVRESAGMMPVQESTQRTPKEEIAEPLLPAQEAAEQASPPKYRVLGQLFRTYLVVEMGESMYIVDQHAAHERILYDRFCAQARAGRVPSQQLIAPEIVTLSPAEYALLEPALDDLRGLGFELEPFGGHAVRVQALPHILGGARMQDFLRELSMSGVAKDAAQLRHEKIAKLACKSAIKAGDVPSELELNTLFTLVLEKGEDITCPHGRPVLFKMTRTALEKTFGRIVG
jgi:DNA mismatch repair protein MutL